MRENPVVRLEKLAATPVAVVRRQARPAELSKVIPEDCGTVWTFVRANGLKAGRNVAIYWDGSIRLEVGVEIEGDMPADGAVVKSATPAGDVATATHLGPYNQLGTAHEAIHRWCATNGRRLGGPSWEIYGHWRPEWNADASLIRTDVFYLLGA
jgi:effector-binding domain-containing protein